MSDDPIRSEAEQIVAAFNDAAPEYAPELTWYGMTTLRDGDEVSEGFVFDTHEYIDRDGLAALQEQGRRVEYVETRWEDGEDRPLSMVMRSRAANPHSGFESAAGDVALSGEEARRIANSLEMLYYATQADTHEPTDRQAARDSMMLRERANIEPAPELLDDDTEGADE